MFAERASRTLFIQQGAQNATLTAAWNAVQPTGQTKLKTSRCTRTHQSPIHPKRGTSQLNTAALGFIATSAGKVAPVSALCAACANSTPALAAMIY